MVGNTLYAAGYFTNVGGVSHRGLAMARVPEPGYTRDRHCFIAPAKEDWFSMMKSMSTAKHSVMFVGSSGGHLAQVCALSSWYEQHDATFVTFRTADAESRLEGEKVYWAYHPTTRNLKNLLLNTALATQLIFREKPDVIVSAGAGVALPFFVLGRALGVITVYIEVIDRLDTPTLTGRLCRPFSTLFCVQWPEQTKLYRGAVVIGRLM